MSDATKGGTPKGQNVARPRVARPSGLSKVPPVKQYPAPADIPVPEPPIAVKKAMVKMTPPPIENETGTLCSVSGTLLGFGNRDYAIGPFPRGYGITLLALSGCYGLLRWERKCIERSKRKPAFTATNVWFSRLKTLEKEYGLARGDFPRTAMLILVGGLGMPYAAAIGALLWCAGRATDFHEARELRSGSDQTEAFLGRFGKFLMICGICKFAFEFARGKVNGVLAD